MNITQTVPGPEELTACTTEAMAELSQFVGLLLKHFSTQLPYNLHTNLPNRIVTRTELPQHTLHSAIVSAIGEYHRWDPEAVTRLAAQVLEDSNIHDLAGLLYQQCEPPPIKRTIMSMMKNYLLNLLTLCSDEQFGQEAVEWAIVSGHIQLTYHREQDLRLILGEPGQPETGQYDTICDAYRRICRQNEATLVESYRPLMEELNRAA